MEIIVLQIISVLFIILKVLVLLQYLIMMIKMVNMVGHGSTTKGGYTQAVGNATININGNYTYYAIYRHPC